MHSFVREQATAALLPVEWPVANAASGWAERHASFAIGHIPRYM
jgi:hypothetical protein